MDILIMGSSRPFLLPYLLDSLHKYVLQFSNKNIRLLLHEDFIIEKLSKETLDIAKDYDIDIISSHNPCIGLGYAMDHMFKTYVSTSYILYLQDDFEFERPIELDRIIWTMEKYPKINLVNFSHYKNMRPTDFEAREVNFEGLKLCRYNGWTFTPGIWRMSKVREKWEPSEIRPEGHFTNKFGTHKQRLSHSYCNDNLGAYCYGGLGDYRYTRHLGSTWRMASWRKEDGGKLHWEFQGLLRDRSPWLDELPERPINPNIKLTEEGREILKNQPLYIQERFK